MVEYTRRVLVIGDDPLVTSYICDLLGEFGYDCRSASARPDAMWLATENNPDVVIVDMNLATMTGDISLANALLECFDSSVIFLSELDNDLTGQVQLVRSVSFLRKPCRASEILGAIEASALCSRTNQEGVPCL